MLFAQIVQYIRLIRPDAAGQDASFYTTSGAGPFPWYSNSGFGDDAPDGHGTHTAGSAAGATLNDPAVAATCSGTDELGCTGGCLNTSFISTHVNNEYYPFDLEVLCPQYGCDGLGESHKLCLDADVGSTLTENGGVAPGAKLSIFDSSADGEGIWASLAGNRVWSATDGTGCKLHSNSWGGESYCTVTSDCVLYDTYMHNVRSGISRFANTRCAVQGLHLIVRVSR